jgi:hypothetical protein
MTWADIVGDTIRVASASHSSVCGASVRATDTDATFDTRNRSARSVPAAGGLEQAVATKRASSLPVKLAIRARTWLLAESRRRIAEDKTSFGTINRGPADADAPDDLRVAKA